MFNFNMGFGAALKSVVLVFLYKFTKDTIDNNGTRELVNTGSGNNAVVLTPEPIDYTFFVKGNDLTTINTQASAFDWNFTEPSGVLSVSYTGANTYLLASDSFLRTSDNKDLGVQ